MNIQNLETQYLKAKIAYYEGNSIMSDAAFDKLEQELKNAGSRVIEQVGSKRKDFDFPHPNPMLSLSKIQTENINEQTNYQETQFQTWFNKRNDIILKNTGNLIDYMFCTPKFDGNAINIIYLNNKIQTVLTRGDGKSGKDITDRFKKYLPECIELSETNLRKNEERVLEIRCEVVINRSIFTNKYADEFANARNYVAGVIGKDDIDVEKVSELSIVPLIILENGKHLNLSLFDDIINSWPIFSKSHSIKIRTGIKEYLSAIKYWEDNRDSFEFQLDGVVFALPYDYRELLGENDHDPEWSIAIKLIPEEVVTSIIGIEWNIGKTGELVPVVLLNPVSLAGTTVKRTSGYNAGYIIDNELGIGSFVSMHKSGDIIPAIKKVVIKSLTPFVLPETCPYCSSLLTFDGIHLMCTNKDCIGRIARILEAGSIVLDLKGIGGKTLEPFAQDFKNIYELMVWVLNGTSNKTIRTSAYTYDIAIEKYGIKAGSRSHEIFYDAFRNIKSLSYAQVILMIGYDGVGKKLAEQVAREYCGLEPSYASMEKALVLMFKQPAIRSYIENAVSSLESLGVIVNKFNNDNNKTTKTMETIYVCMTGTPSPIAKTKAEFISQFSNVEEVSITDKRCNFLITDSYNSTSNKMKVAEKKGIKIVTYEDFKI